jgi:hypothetical protein
MHGREVILMAGILVTGILLFNRARRSIVRLVVNCLAEGDLTDANLR